jgi:hypothetical protein
MAVSLVQISLLEETLLPTTKRRTFPTDLAGTVQILGDIVSPNCYSLVKQEDRSC